MEEAHVFLYEKYKNLVPYVERIEPSSITMMYKEYKSKTTFYPNIGLFFNEFALIYSTNLQSTRKH